MLRFPPKKRHSFPVSPSSSSTAWACLEPFRSSRLRTEADAAGCIEPRINVPLLLSSHPYSIIRFSIFVCAAFGFSSCFRPVDDRDGDGFAAGFDCDDTNADVSPLMPELCNAIDDNCNGEVDEQSNDKISCYVDADGDSFGNSLYAIEACSCPAGYVERADDCNDGDALQSPEALERCNGVDDDCDDAIDELADEDGDGFPPCPTLSSAGDCDDGDPAVSPFGTEVCDGIDQDCNGVVDDAGDGDGDGWALCEGDCNDTLDSVHPLAEESCDRLDNDCNGQIDELSDRDGDGYTSCGNTDLSADCDDLDGSIHPGAEESCDGRDQDCDGQADDGFADGDGDGAMSCVDCDDADPARSPQAFEACDGKDNNCTGLADDGGDCPCEVAWYDGHVYQFCLDTGDWLTAQSRCSTYGYRLLQIGDSLENDWVTVTANSLLIIDWWIGLSDLSQEGTFRWEDGTSPSYTRWAGGEPNNLNNEDCVQIYADGTWNDKNCSSTWYRYICEAGQGG